MNNIKKVELHIHLDGSLRPETVLELGKREGILPKDYTLDQIRKDLSVNSSDKTLVDYLKKFDMPIALMQSKKNIDRVAFELVEDLAKEGTIYAEIRVAPIQHLKEGLTSNEVIEAILAGFKRAEDNYPIKVRLLLCAMRHLPPIESDFLIDMALKYKNQGVVGLDLAGDEAGFSALLFKDFFKKATEKNIPFTIHAGEAVGVDSIISAIELGAKRLGHGVRAFEDENVMETLRQKEICLECCPISNNDTHAIKDFTKYPIIDFLNKGIPVTLNTDNRTVSNTNYSKEIDFLEKNIVITNKDIKQFNINAINHAFISNELKNKLIIQIKEGD